MSLQLKMYPNPFSVSGDYSASEMRRGLQWISTDVICPHCNKVQPLAATFYLGGPCVQCGKNTDGTCIR